MNADRREARRTMPVRMFRLGEEPGDDISATTTAEQRLEMLWILSRRMVELSGQVVPSTARRDLPIRVVTRP